MAIFGDIILIVIIIFLASYILFSFLPMTFFSQLICSMLSTFVLTSIINKLFLKNKKGEMSYRNFLTYLIWQGEEYTKELIKSISSNNFQDKGEFVIIDKKVIFVWTKYANLSADTLIRFYRICQKNNIKNADIFTTNFDKKSLYFVKRFGDVTINIQSFKWLYKLLKKTNSLPSTPKSKLKAKDTIYLIMQTAFNKKNCIRFLFLSILFLAISFVTPFSNYYIFLSIFNLILAIISLAFVIKQK